MKLHHLIAAAMLCLSVAMLTSCMPPQAMPRAQNVSRLGDEKIVRVVLMSGETIRFDFAGARYYAKYKNKTHVIVGKTAEGQIAELDRDNVLRVYTARDSHQEAFSQALFPTLFIFGSPVKLTATSSSSTIPPPRARCASAIGASG
jgi:hypothetical protein